MTTMDWIKKNWMTIAVVALVIALMVYIVNRMRKAKGESEIKPIKLTRSKTGVVKPSEEKESLSSLKNKLADCEDKMKSARISTGGVHPCANLRDLVSNAESNYYGPFTETNGLNIVDFGMGLDGMSLLEDKNLKAGESNYRTTKPRMCRYPDGTPVLCSEMENIKSSASLV